MEEYRDESSVHRTSAEFNKLHKINTLVAEKLKMFINDEITILKDEVYDDDAEYYVEYLKLFSSLDMDIYTISRFFLQSSDEVIIYAGHNHIDNYQRFLSLHLNAKIIFRSDIDTNPYKDVKCVTIPKNIFNPYVYRQSIY